MADSSASAAASPTASLLPAHSAAAVSVASSGAPPPPSSSHWRAPLCSLRSAAFGVAASVAAKFALTDSWTHWIADHIDDAWGNLSAAAATHTSAVPHKATIQPSATDEEHPQLVFYAVRVSLVLVKLYLDSRMLHHFVRSMHASNSLLASTFNQCFSIILAGVCGLLLFSESLPSTWLLGVALILAGVGCVQWGNSDEETNADEPAREDPTQVDAATSSDAPPSTTALSDSNSDASDDDDQASLAHAATPTASARSLRSRQSTTSRRPPS